MYYNNELILEAVDLLKKADKYISDADIGDDGKTMVNNCQEIYDAYEVKNKQVSTLSIDESLSDITLDSTIVTPTNGISSLSDNSNSDGEEFNPYELLNELLLSGELTEEEETIAKEYLDTGNIPALVYFLMVKLCEIDKKNLEQEQEDFHSQKLSDFIDLPEDLKGYGEWTILEIMVSSDYKNTLGEEIVAQIYAKENELRTNIEYTNQQIFQLKQELGKAEYWPEYSKGYEPLDIPTEQVEAIEYFLNDYMSDYYIVNHRSGVIFFDAFYEYNSTKGNTKIDPYNLLLYLQQNPKALARYFITRIDFSPEEEIELDIDNASTEELIDILIEHGIVDLNEIVINSPEDLIKFLDENGIYLSNSANQYIQFEAYRYLDPSVLVVYQNIYYTEGEEAALRFLSVYQDDINRETGYELAVADINSILNNDTNFGKMMDSLGIGTEEGIIAYFEGWAKIFDNEGTMTVNDYRMMFFTQILLAADSMDVSEIQRQYAAGEITKKEYDNLMLLAEWAKESDDLKIWCNRFYSAGISVGQQIPSLCISYLTMGIGSSLGLAGKSLSYAAKTSYNISMFGSQFGTEKNIALRKGSSLTTAYLYGIFKASSEVAVENLFQIPGIPEEGLIQIAYTDSTMMKLLKGLVINFIERPGGEIVEELIQNVIDGGIEYGFYAEKYTFQDWYDSLGETGITTYISTLILGANGIITDLSRIRGVKIEFKDGTMLQLKPDQIKDMVERHIIEIKDGEITINDYSAFAQEVIEPLIPSTIPDNVVESGETLSESTDQVITDPNILAKNLIDLTDPNSIAQILEVDGVKETIIQTYDDNNKLKLISMGLKDTQFIKNLILSIDDKNLFVPQALLYIKDNQTFTDLLKNDEIFNSFCSNTNDNVKATLLSKIVEQDVLVKFASTILNKDVVYSVIYSSILDEEHKVALIKNKYQMFDDSVKQQFIEKLLGDNNRNLKIEIIKSLSNWKSQLVYFQLLSLTDNEQSEIIKHISQTIQTPDEVVNFTELIIDKLGIEEKTQWLKYLDKWKAKKESWTECNEVWNKMDILYEKIKSEILSFLENSSSKQISSEQIRKIISMLPLDIAKRYFKMLDRISYVENMNEYAKSKQEKYKTFIDDLAKKWGIEYQKVWDILTEKIKELVNNNVFGMRRTLDCLDLILNSGVIKNQFETCTSDGAENQDLRRDVENEIFQIPVDTDAISRPTYGMIFPKFNSLDDRVVNYYKKGPGVHFGYGWNGGCVIIFKKDNIINNTTITLGDSLNNKENVVASEASNPIFSGAFFEFANNASSVEDFKKMNLMDLFYYVHNDKRGRYLELQYHGLETHVIDNIEEIILFGRGQKLPSQRLIDKIEKLGIRCVKLDFEELNNRNNCFWPHFKGF